MAGIFFRGAADKYPWGQGGGINAGCMLLAPSPADFKQMVNEIAGESHPEHVSCAGPEQDYLSRYWASCWTHIGAEQNFKLHHIYFALSPDRPLYDYSKHYQTEEAEIEENNSKTKDVPPPARVEFLLHPERIKILRYSGALKQRSRP